MEILYSLGIDDKDIKFMLEQVSSIKDMSEEEINEKIDILKYVGCNYRHIKNIIISNPYYLCRMNEDILKLISYLKKIGINNVNLLFDSNPFFLNYDRFEIEEYVNNKLDIGMELEDIIDSIEDNPYIIDED